MIKVLKTISAAAFATVLSVNSVASDISFDSVNKGNFEEELSNEIKSFCDGFSRSNVRVYCVQAQYSAYANLSMLLSKNSQDNNFLQIYTKCTEKFSNIDSFSKTDYAMTYACLNHNSERLNLKFKR